jgi:hypothetical protein
MIGLVAATAATLKEVAMNRRVVIVAVISFLALWHASAWGQQFEVQVYAYSHVLDPSDTLRDGPDGREFTLDGETLLIWVDKEPQAFFAHPTAYILISSDGVRVEQGMWWPVLNGRRILYGKRNRASFVSPFEVAGDGGEAIDVYFYPEELIPGDHLADGDFASADMWSETFLVWVDMMPGAFFTHPTIYILVTAEKRTIIYHGEWWPLLNGKDVLYNNAEKYAVSFPFGLSRE